MLGFFTPEETAALRRALARGWTVVRERAAF
jgi:hypothetical protein